MFIIPEEPSLGKQQLSCQCPVPKARNLPSWLKRQTDTVLLDKAAEATVIWCICVVQILQIKQQQIQILLLHSQFKQVVFINFKFIVGKKVFRTWKNSISRFLYMGWEKCVNELRVCVFLHKWAVSLFFLTNKGQTFPVI